MTDKPIIFSAPMVRALIEGRKTQTRRVLKVHPDREPPYVAKYETGARAVWIDEEDTVWSFRGPAVGDRLWVKEAWRTDLANDHLRPSELDPGTATVWFDASSDWNEGQRPRYRNARFMPRWASRWTPTVTDVRVQRVQDISEADAVAEGATPRGACSGFLSRDTGWSMDWSRVGQLSAYATRPPGGPAKMPLQETDISLGDPQMAFASYWNDLHGPEAWDRNDWVAAYTFTVQRGNIDDVIASEGAKLLPPPDRGAA